MEPCHPVFYRTHTPLLPECTQTASAQWEEFGRAKPLQLERELEFYELEGHVDMRTLKNKCRRLEFPNH